MLAQLLAGLDERPGDVAVLDEAVVLREPGRARESAGRRVARVGHRDHQVGVDRGLAPQDLAHPPARHLEHGAGHLRVRPREVDVLEHAERAPLAAGHHPRLHAAVGERDHLAGQHLAQVLGADQVERARLAGDAVGRLAGVLVLDHPERERAQPVRIAERDDRVLGQHDGRERALQPREHVGDRVLDPLGGVGREQRGDDLGVRRRAERESPIAQLRVQLDRVDQVAVVRERQRAAVVTDDRLRVLPGRRAGGRVANVADRHVADERAELVLVEHLRDEALVADRHDLAAARGGGDPGRLLAAVLERVQREVREIGDVVSRRKDAEDAALVARSVAMVVHRRGHAQPAAKASSGPRPIRSDPPRAPRAARKLRDRAAPRSSARRRRPRRSRRSRRGPRASRTR